MNATLPRSGSLGAVTLAEARCEALKALRLPAFLVPTLVFPAMFYGLFGIVLGRGMPIPGMTMSAYLLASYGTFGVVGAALFGMGIGVAADRGQGWLTLKRATPMPPLAYFLAKTAVSIMLGAAIALLLAGIANAFGGVRLSGGAWITLFITLALGTVPFCAFGCALGYLSGPNSAPMIANLIYLPMSLASGLWIPLEFMPGFIRSIAPFLPPYHLARLALVPIGGDASRAGLHLAALGLATALFLLAAVLLYRRDDGRTWG